MDIYISNMVEFLINIRFDFLLSLIFYFLFFYKKKYFIIYIIYSFRIIEVLSIVFFIMDFSLLFEKAKHHEVSILCEQIPRFIKLIGEKATFKTMEQLLNDNNLEISHFMTDEEII